MAGGQWEVVGGKAKKTKVKSSPKPKKDDKSNGTPNFAVPGPIAESKTVFNTFLDKEKKENQPSKLPKPIEPVKTKEKSGPSHKKKGDKKAAASKTSLEDLFSSITEEDVKNHLATLEVLLPNSPLLWLKDLATFFNVKLDISIDAAAITSKPSGYPSSLLKKGVYSHIVKTFNRCSPQTMQIFHEFCLNNLVQDGLKGLHILGYCTILQCIAQEMPSIASSNIAKCAELCTAYSNRQNICLWLWWVAGQVGSKDLETGFQIWLQLMFPMIGEKNCSSYAIEYLEELINKAKKSGFKKNIIQVKEFFPLLDFIHSKELPKGIQKRMVAAYPTIKLLSCGHDPENNLRNFFPSYLRRLEPQCPQPLKSEILSSLVHCLGKDVRCFSVWRQLYTKHFIQSKLLIAHINDEWENLPSNFPKKCLFDTLSVFQVTNEEHVNNPKKSVDVEECILINKELLLKMNSSKYSWSRVIILFILLVSILLTVDIMLHNSFAESNIGNLMKNAGLSAVCTQAGEKLLYFYGKVKKLLETYVPSLLNWCRTTMIPYVELFIKELMAMFRNLWNSTASWRTWCNKHFPPILEQIENQVPSLQRNLSTFLTGTSTLVVNYISYAWKSAESVAISLQSNDNIAYVLEMTSKHSSALVSSIQDYSASLLNYARSYMQ